MLLTYFLTLIIPSVVMAPVYLQVTKIFDNCFSYMDIGVLMQTKHSYCPYFSGVMAKRYRREVGFQDGGCFSRFLKRERINNYTFITFLNCG